MGAPPYTYSFTMDGVPLSTTNRVSKWKEGRGGKVAKSVREALLLPKDMKHWAKWDNDSLLLTIKREAIMVTISSHSNYYFLHFSFFFSFFTKPLSSLHDRGINAPW